jgi:hypothetical protein
MPTMLLVPLYTVVAEAFSAVPPSVVVSTSKSCGLPAQRCTVEGAVDGSLSSLLMPVARTGRLLVLSVLEKTTQNRPSVVAVEVEGVTVPPVP